MTRIKPRVYLETTIISYLTAWRSPELVVAANQEATREWWDDRRHGYELYASSLVVLEVSAGDAAAAGRRLNMLASIAEIDITDEARHLAKRFVTEIPFAENSQVDALHIALATVHGMDYLLTWNCRHIANAVLRPRIDLVSREYGYDPPVICTPLELME